MKSTSKVIIGATLVMGVSLVILLGLVLVLLTELCCSLLPGRRRLRNTKPNASTNTDSSPPTQTQEQSASPLSSFYAQGVLDAPRSSLFPAVSSKENEVEMKNQSFQFHHGLMDILTQEPNTSPHCLGVISPSYPSTSIINLPQPIQETTTQVGSNSDYKNKACGGGGRGGVGGEHFEDISNTTNENDVSRMSREDTPFETPETSPSRLESGDCSSGEEDETAQPIGTV